MNGVKLYAKRILLNAAIIATKRKIAFGLEMITKWVMRHTHQLSTDNFLRKGSIRALYNPAVDINYSWILFRLVVPAF